jgi:hypothetical protein
MMSDVSATVEKPVETVIARDAQPVIMEKQNPTEGSNIIANNTPSTEETIIAVDNVPEGDVMSPGDATIALAENAPTKETIVLSDDAPRMATTVLKDEGSRHDITEDDDAAEPQSNSISKPEVIFPTDTIKSIGTDAASDSPSTPDAAGALTATIKERDATKKTKSQDNVGHGARTGPSNSSPVNEETFPAIPTQEKDNGFPVSGSGANLEPSATPGPESKTDSEVAESVKSVKPAIPDEKDEDGDEELPEYSPHPSNDQAPEKSMAVNLNIEMNNIVDEDTDNETETSLSISFSNKTSSRSVGGRSSTNMTSISINTSQSTKSLGRSSLFGRRRKN